MKKLFILLTMLIVGIGSMWGQSTPTVISINFNSGNGTVSGTGGLVLADNWNNLTGANSSESFSLNKSDGTSSGASVTWTSSNTWSWGGSTNDWMKGYLDDGGSGVSIEIADIPYENYNVIIYQATDQGAGGSFYTPSVNGTYYSWDGSQTGNSAFQYGATRNPSAILGVNTMYLKGFTSNSLSIQGNVRGYGSSIRSCISAIQIVEVRGNESNIMYPSSPTRITSSSSLTAGKFYLIEGCNQDASSGNNSRYLYDNGSDYLKGAYLNNVEIEKYLWQLIGKDNAWTLKNVSTGKYISINSNAQYPIRTSDKAQINNIYFANDYATIRNSSGQAIDVSAAGTDPISYQGNETPSGSRRLCIYEADLFATDLAQYKTELTGKVNSLSNISAVFTSAAKTAFTSSLASATSVNDAETAYNTFLASPGTTKFSVSSKSRGSGTAHYINMGSTLTTSSTLTNNCAYQFEHIGGGYFLFKNEVGYWGNILSRGSKISGSTTLSSSGFYQLEWNNSASSEGDQVNLRNISNTKTNYDYIHEEGGGSYVVDWEADSDPSKWTIAQVTNIYNVAADATETLSKISNYSTYLINVPVGSTLVVDVENFDLTKISGAGNIVLAANNNSLVSEKSTVNIGKLTVNENVTLTVGNGCNYTASIASFTSVDLKGTIYIKNSKTTINTLTIPEGSTGTINLWDTKNKTEETFKLAGTTTLNGKLTFLNTWKGQATIEKVVGVADVDIIGWQAGSTASNDCIIYTIADATEYTGSVTLNNPKNTVNVSGNLIASSWTKTQGTINYTGSNLNGTTLDGVIIEGTTRITTSNTVTIKNLAGNNLSNTSNNYAFVGSGTLNFYGTCDLTKRSDGTTASTCSKIGYPSDSYIIIKTGATVTASNIYNADKNNAAITVEGTISATFFGGAATLAEGSTTTLSDATPFDGAVTVSGNATLNLTNATSTLNRAITVAEGKTLTINGGSNTVNFGGSVSGAGNIVLSYFPTAATHPTLTDWTGAIEFPENASASNITDIFNAWGNENSTIKLNDISGYFSNTTTPVKPTLNILSGKTLTINNGYSDYPPTLSKLTGEGNLNISWNGSRDPYKLTVQKLEDFSGTLSTVNAPIVVEKLVCANPPYVNTRLIKTTGTVTLEKLYIGLERTTAYTWETKTVDEVKGIYVATFNEVQLRREMAVATVSPYFNHIGTGVGMYTISLGKDEKYTSIPEFTAAIEAWSELSDCSTPIVTINQPTSAFYRIKAGDKYLQDVRKSDDATQRTLTDAEGAGTAIGTLFYLNDDTFIGYQTGYGFGFSVCQTRDTEHLNSMLFTESAEKGKYTIQSQQGTCTSATYNEGYWGVDGSDLSRVNDAESGACWTLEPATSVPVTFKKSALGYATFFTPAPLRIPKNGSGEYDIHGYVCKMDGTKLTFYDITNVEDEVGRIIPVNTAVMLYNSTVKDGEDDEVVVNFTISSKDDVVIDNNSFRETLATVTPETLSTFGGKQHTIYSLRTKTKTDGSKVMGFYERTSTSNCAGFKAWLMTEKEAQARNFTIYFDGEEAPTGIIEALGLQNDNVEIYDLNGRKLSSYKKGINIVNGKKVMVQ